MLLVRQNQGHSPQEISHLLSTPKVETSARQPSASTSPYIPELQSKQKHCPEARPTVWLQQSVPFRGRQQLLALPIGHRELGEQRADVVARHAGQREHRVRLHDRGAILLVHRQKTVGCLPVKCIGGRGGGGEGVRSKKGSRVGKSVQVQMQYHFIILKSDFRHSKSDKGVETKRNSWCLPSTL